jgi:DNA-binding CsgD family transcriptional regulator/energy-coupling factor transporter ATP-binding protein EcfA2
VIARTTLGRRFVGRTADLDYLLGRHLDAARLRARTVLVTGPPGIGKSRLLREMRGALTHRRTRVVESACLAIARQPYAPILDILAEIDPEAAVRTRRAANRREQLDIVCEALLHFAERQTLVAVIEDLHWADAATLELLEFLTNRIGKVRLLLVLSSRLDFESSTRLARLAASDLVDRLDLAPLDPGDCESFVEDALGGRELGAAGRARVIRIAEGNPFYIEELLKTTVERGEPSVPASLAAALLERTSTLARHAREILEAAAVLGIDFDVATLTATSGSTREDAIDALLAASDLQMLVERGPDRYAFRHALTREALYGSIPAVRAVSLHRAALDVYRASSKTSLERLAYHAWHARDFALAAKYAEEAGIAAMQSFAHEDAIAQFERSLAALEAVSGTPIETRVRVYERRALAYIAAGSNADAFDDYVAAAQLLAGIDAREREAEMRVNAAVQAYRNGDPQARTGLETMLATLTPGDRAAASRLHVGLAQLNANVYRSTAALEHLAHVDLTVVSERPTLAYAYASASAVVRYIEGDVGGYSRAFDTWLAAAHAVDGAPDVPLVHYNGAMYFSILGVHERALELFARGLEISKRRRDRMAESATQAMASMAYLAVGDLENVRRSVDAVYDLATDGKIARAHAAAWGSIAAAHLGDDLLLTRCVDIAGLEPFAEPMCAGGYAPWLVQQGFDAKARALLHRATVHLERPRGLFNTLLAVARYGDVDDLPIARAHLERAAAASGDVVEAPALALFDAYVAQRERRGADAALFANEAVAGFARLGYPLLQAQALELGGRIDEAIAIYRGCAAAGDLKRLLPPVAPATRSLADRAADRLATNLSVREREIAALVASGSTNRAIGERLNCSTKTIEKHVATIFRKAGVSSRVQLAAWVIDGNLRDRETA